VYEEANSSRRKMLHIFVSPFQSHVDIRSTVHIETIT
jgi:hypothetical protein